MNEAGRNTGLKPCPFCGAPITVWDTGFGIVSVIECKTCRTKFVFPYSRKGYELGEFWNTRYAERLESTEEAEA